jgi:hypothetical protein
MKYDIHEEVHFQHEVTYYVPYYLKTDDGYPTFEYSMSEATTDEQMAWSFEPYGVFELKGTFDAKTPPLLDYLTEHGNGD